MLTTIRVRESYSSFLRMGAVCAAMLMLTGCLSDTYQSSRGVSLSQAMQSSASGGKEPLHGTESTETYSSIGADSAVSGPASAGSGGDAMLVSYNNNEYNWQALADVAYSVPFSGDIQSLTRFTITPASVEDERNYFGVFLSGDIVNLRSGSLPNLAINNTSMLEAGLAYRRYLTPAHTFISPYVTASVASQLLAWDYRNPINVNGDPIQSDSLEGLGGYAGFGVAIKRNSHLSFFGEAGFGGTVLMGETTQGFNNDVFHNFGYFSVKAGLCVKF